MKTYLIALLTGVLLAIVSAHGQGAFQNLNFEAAHNLPAFGNVATTNALPGWAAYSGTNQLSTIFYNNAAFFSQVGLYGPNFDEISGYFSVELYKGGVISQTGIVPANAISLFFKGSWGGLAPPLGVSLGGQNISYSAISSGTNYTLYGANISVFAGQSARLDLLSFSSSGSAYFIDDIEFSTQIIPEPSSLAFLLTGGIIAFHRLLRRRKS